MLTRTKKTPRCVVVIMKKSPCLFLEKQLAEMEETRSWSAKERKYW